MERNEPKVWQALKPHGREVIIKSS